MSIESALESLVLGLGEKAIVEVLRRVANGEPVPAAQRKRVRDILAELPGDAEEAAVDEAIAQRKARKGR